MPLSDWIIGSEVQIPETTISVTVGATSEDVTLAAGSYYLWDSTVGISLIDSIATAFNDHSLLSDVEAEIMENRKVRIFSPTTAFDATFDSANARAMAGFTGNFGSTAMTYTAQTVSDYLWVPQRLSCRDLARKGTQGNPVHDTSWVQSADGAVSTTRHNTQKINSKTWRYIPIDRIHTTSEADGELYSFFESVISKGYNFKVYNSLTNDESSTTPVTFGTAYGPYILHEKSGQTKFSWRREIKNVEKFGTYELPMVTCTEYS